MNQSQNGYSYQRGWAVPALGVLGGIVFVFGGGWLILSSLFSEVGTKAAATIVMIAGSCGVSGVLLALVVVAIVHSIREPRVQVQAPPQASYEILPAQRQPPVLLPASNSLTRFQSSGAQQAELRFRDEPPVMVSLAAVEDVVAMPVIRRPENWSHSNASYGAIKRYFVENNYAVAQDGKAGQWVAREKAIALLREWQRR